MDQETIPPVANDAVKALVNLSAEEDFRNMFIDRLWTANDSQ
jgi:hypothetical protein